MLKMIQYMKMRLFLIEGIICSLKIDDRPFLNGQFVNLSLTHDLKVLVIRNINTYQILEMKVLYFLLDNSLNIKPDIIFKRKE